MEPAAKQRTWTEPGPGRRQCEACGVYCGVRSKACPSCGADFLAAALAAQAAKHAAELAAAKAAREARAAREAQQAAAQAPTAASGAHYTVTGGVGHPDGVVVIAESGPPPVPCPSTLDEASVREWAAACVARTKDYLTVGALLLWLRRYDSLTRQWISAVPGVAVEVPT